MVLDSFVCFAARVPTQDDLRNTALSFLCVHASSVVHGTAVVFIVRNFDVDFIF